jgi:hypothetical protein
MAKEKVDGRVEGFAEDKGMERSVFGGYTLHHEGIYC